MIVFRSLLLLRWGNIRCTQVDGLILAPEEMKVDTAKAQRKAAFHRRSNFVVENLFP
jgi:hypothetical protein